MGPQTLVGVKQVKQDIAEEWDESMPLPGDIIEGVGERDDEQFFMAAKGRSELNSQLGWLNRQVDFIWVKVRRGDSTIKLQACTVVERGSKLQRRFTIRAASDERHVAVLADLTLEQCAELQEMSRKVVNVEKREFSRIGVKYDWRKKVDTFLPDNRASVISSILFMPLTSEHTVEETHTRSMAWFIAAVSSGVPIIFVNIQTEPYITSERTTSSVLESGWGKQHGVNTTIQIAQCIRIWFLPGVAEVPITLIPESGEYRFGMDLKPTEEGFLCINSVARGSAADRAGLGQLRQQAIATRHLLVISRLEGKSLMPSTATSTGLVNCCDHNDVKEVLISVIDKTDGILLHIMSWPPQNAPSPAPQSFGAASLCPPSSSFSVRTTLGPTSSGRMFNESLIVI